MLPNFLIVGTQKAGTTSLWNYLRQHPDVFMPEVKEVNFFKSSARNYDCGLEWYESFFDGHSGEKAVGEASPRYMMYEEVPARIAKMDSTVRLIFILRNPVDRAYSHYWHSVRDGYETLSFEEAIEQENFRIEKSEFAMRAYSYVTRGFYYQQILSFLECFPLESMLFLLFWDLVHSRQELLQETHRFLGVNEDFVPEKISNVRNKGQAIRSMKLHRFFLSDAGGRLTSLIGRFIPKSLGQRAFKQLRILNKGGKYSPMSNGTRESLIRLFEAENEKLSALINRDLDHWNS